jgi:DNA-binding transcriptional regulator LsrR (DeoR family)
VISKEVLAARAAWLQLIDGRTHIEIAEILEVSRLRVPKLVRWAEQNGLVSIAIEAPSGVDWIVADKLRERFGLVDVLVSTQSSLNAVARLAARYVCEVLIEGGLLGIAWGTTTQAMVAEIELLPDVPQSDVVQLIGGLPESETAWHSTELLVHLSNVLGGSAAALLSPMILPDAQTAMGLRAEPSIAHAFKLMQGLSVAVVGIGAWDAGGSRVRSELDTQDVKRTRDVVADVCGVLLNSDGRVVHEEISARIMSIDATTLRESPVRIGIAVGERKADAISSSLKSGLLSVLCTDRHTAEQVLAADERRPGTQIP